MFPIYIDTGSGKPPHGPRTVHRKWSLLGILSWGRAKWAGMEVSNTDRVPDRVFFAHTYTCSCIHYLELLHIIMCRYVY